VSNAAGPLAPHPADQLSADHLSLDQIDDHLIGDLAAAPTAHLAACSLCASRVAAAAAPFASFQRVTTAWGDRHSATLPVPIVSRQRPLWQRHLGWATACLSLAVGIALTNTSQGWFALGTREPQPATQQAAQQVSTQQVSEQQVSEQQVSEAASFAPSPHAAQISADNQMLHDIDTALDTSAETPAALGLQTPSDQPTAPPTSLQD
jgi:hypothetical protein